MKHPGPLLTDYVDGTLSPNDAGRVEEHLRVCATCREEVRLAAAASEALGSVSEPAPPAGLADAAIAEAERLAAARAPEVTPLRSSASHRPRPSTPRWLAVAGAAAAIALIALVVPKLGQPGDSTSTAAAGAGDFARPAATTVEVQDVDYGSDILARVAATFDTAYVAGVRLSGPCRRRVGHCRPDPNACRTRGGGDVGAGAASARPPDVSTTPTTTRTAR